MAPTSSDPPPKHKKIKTKTKNSQNQMSAQPSGVNDVQGNRNVDAHLDWKPPPGAVSLKHDVDAGSFDWDAVKGNDDLELWLVRIPDELKPKYLENMKIQLPTSSRTVKVGSLSRKAMSCDIWSVGDEEARTVGGEEIKHLSCLLPRKKKGCLMLAPKPIARHIVISAQPTKPSTAASSQIVHQNPPRFSYPPEVLKHRFLPYGSQLAAVDGLGDTSNDDMDVEMQDPTPVESIVPVDRRPQVSNLAVKEPKTKKRKGEIDVPRKTKKPKVAS